MNQFQAMRIKFCSSISYPSIISPNSINYKFGVDFLGLVNETIVDSFTIKQKDLIEIELTISISLQVQIIEKKLRPNDKKFTDFFLMR